MADRPSRSGAGAGGGARQGSGGDADEMRPVQTRPVRWQPPKLGDGPTSPTERVLPSLCVCLKLSTNKFFGL